MKNRRILRSGPVSALLLTGIMTAATGSPLPARPPERADPAAVPIRVEAPLVEFKGRPGVEVRIGNLTVRAQIDVGGGGKLSLNNRYIESLALTSEPSIIGRSITSEGEFPVLQAGFEGAARLGTLTVPLSSLRFMESVSDAVLSRDLLSNFRITFDPARNRVRFLPDGEKPARMQETAAAAPNLDPDLPDLRASFNADPDKVRLLLILSPT